MKKPLLATSLLLISVAALSQNYCIPASSVCSNNDVITRVVVETLDNISTCSPNGYINYSGTVPVPTLYTGISTPVAVTVGHRGAENVGLWIDYDHDDSLETNEFTFVGRGDGVTLNNLINIPANALTGPTRMRVRLKYTTNILPTDNCATFNNGETEDYIVNLATPASCGGIPLGGRTIASVLSACPADSILLSVSASTSNVAGLTYQWQLSRDSIAWEDIAGKTSLTALVYQDSIYFYRRRITCSGNSSFSLPVKVLQKALLQCYCRPALTDCSQNDLIKNVTFGSLSRNSLCSPYGYMDYTTIVAPPTVTAGPEDISVLVGPGGPQQVAAWIDYDHNGGFEPSEYTYIGVGNGVVISNQIIIPATALWGTTRMRVRVRYNILLDSTNSCSYIPYGETEDYAINITGTNHCIPEGISDCTGADVITRVAFGTIDTTTGCSPNGYNNFTTGTPATINAGSFEYINVLAGCNPDNPGHVGVWIDFNQDNVFGINEFTMLRNECGVSITDSISIPCNAKSGPTIMRVRNSSDFWYNSSDACDAFVNGETEDYRVNIIASTCTEYLWTGLAGTSNWEDAANWSCLRVPDKHSVVVINSGTVNINSNAIVYSLNAAAAATVNVAPAFSLTVTH